MRVIRETLENCYSYNCAYKKLRDNTLGAPAYLTVAGSGPYQGAIISRNNYDVAHIESLSQSTNEWFKVQTNDDHWTGKCT